MSSPIAQPVQNMAQTLDAKSPVVVDAAPIKPSLPPLDTSGSSRKSAKPSRSSRKWSRRNRAPIFPPYSDEPDTVYVFASDLEAAKQDHRSSRKNPRPAPLRDLLVVIFLLALLLVIGGVCLHWYGDFAEQWRVDNAGRFVEEVLRRERLIVSRGLAA